MNSLTRFWSRYQSKRAPYFHPDDEEFIAENEGWFDKQPFKFRDFVTSDKFGDFNDSKFHLSLPPHPYGGNLDKADIFVLLLNPGFSAADHYDTRERRRRVQNMLYQEFKGERFPFLSLDPYLCWRSGSIWWERKLRSVLCRIAEHKNLSYQEAMRDLAHRFAAIELVPYHSRSFKYRRIIDDLPSANAARQFVEKTLLPKAKAGRAVVIITRKVERWGVRGKNIICYQGSAPRAASLSVNSAGGKAILKRYGIKTSR